MRIIVVGPLLFGYYRDTPKGEFRASGMGLVRREGLPAEALEEAWRISEKPGHRRRGGGLHHRRHDSGRRKVIEFSSYIRVDDPEELWVDGAPGVYVRERPGSFAFRPGRFWFPEVALAEALCRSSGLDTARLLVDAVRGRCGDETEAEVNSSREPYASLDRPAGSRGRRLVRPCG